MKQFVTPCSQRMGRTRLWIRKAELIYAVGWPRLAKNWLALTVPRMDIDANTGATETISP